MSNLPKRSDPIYKEIESFEDYELTNRVAYEMAIRNQEAQKLMEHISVGLGLLIEDLKLYENDKRRNEQFNNALDEYESLCDDAYGNIEILDKLEPPEYYEAFFLNQIVVDIKDYLKTLVTNYWIRDFYIEDIVEEIKHRQQEDLYYLSKKQEKLLRELGVMKNLQHLSKSSDGRVVMTGDVLFDPPPIESLKEIFSNNHIRCKQVDINKIFVSVSLKYLIIPKTLDNTVDISLNLNLPKSELIAYVEKLKDTYEMDRGMIKSPLQLLNEELQVADDISKMCTENKNGKELCFDGRKGITRTQKLADMFFIYDMVKNGYKELRIRTAISEYYESEYNKKTDTSDATFRKYRDIAKDYIDNKRYKELITGVKS